MAITDFTSIGKLLLDLAKFFRDELKERKSIGPITLGALIQLYGECSKLTDELPRLRAALEADLANLDSSEQETMSAVLRRIGRIGELFRDIDIEILNLYYPGAGDATRALIGLDIELNSTVKDIARTFGIDTPDSPRVFHLLVREFHIAEQTRWEFERPPWRHIDVSETAINALDSLAEVLTPIRELLGHIIKTHWSINERAGK